MAPVGMQHSHCQTGPLRQLQREAGADSDPDRQEPLFENGEPAHLLCQAREGRRARVLAAISPIAWCGEKCRGRRASRPPLPPPIRPPLAYEPRGIPQGSSEEIGGRTAVHRLRHHPNLGYPWAPVRVTVAYEKRGPSGIREDDLWPSPKTAMIESYAPWWEWAGCMPAASRNIFADPTLLVAVDNLGLPQVGWRRGMDPALWVNGRSCAISGRVYGNTP